jgi:hypothetical protein
MALLIEAGLVNGQMPKSLNQEVNDFFVHRLTWEGHEFLDSIAMIQFRHKDGFS